MKITLVYGDDWKGLYINGQLKLQNHDLDVRDVLEAINSEDKFVGIEVLEADAGWLADAHEFPDNLEHVECI